MTYEELTDALNEYLNGGSEDDSVEKKEKVVSSTVTESTNFDAKDTASAFDDLFNK